jgi:hypothetical protein
VQSKYIIITTSCCPQLCRVDNCTRAHCIINSIRLLCLPPTTVRVENTKTFSAEKYTRLYTRTCNTFFERINIFCRRVQVFFGVLILLYINIWIFRLTISIGFLFFLTVKYTYQLYTDIFTNRKRIYVQKRTSRDCRSHNRCCVNRHFQSQASRKSVLGFGFPVMRLIVRSHLRSFFFSRYPARAHRCVSSYTVFRTSGKTL